MTLPWYLNPWAEVRRWEREAHAQHKWALKERAARKDAEAKPQNGKVRICAQLESFDIRKAFPTHPDFGEVIRMVPAEELERIQAENVDLRRRLAEMERQPVEF
ncbi:hypothetical protein A0U94_05295 [Gluconobacter albidus]|uniref:hypothetical protein n=1 Tax=Gluconobacter albidus TaxID=318683 RepID=UPI00098B4B0B|nr:hypothetical protein [Gluconobacter albidus]AQS90471.1 hypothetical protein A0U94_05295 [Gluconobacter albidus]